MDKLTIPKNLLSIDDLNIENLDYIFSITSMLKKGIISFNTNKLIGLLFLEPSSRTLMSFEAAIKKIGGNSVKLDLDKSSIEKGESIEDTIRCISSYVDLLVIRTNQSNKLPEYLELIDKPIINAGDGSNEHPTQALIDFYTIKENFKILNNLTITIIGDLRYSRTVHSLVKLISKYNNTIKINYISPKGLSIPTYIKTNIRNKQYEFYGMKDINSIIASTDVLYLTRIQKERHKELLDIDEFLSNYVIDEHIINYSKYSLIIMHPLPRNNELSKNLDKNYKSKYFDQMKNGLYVRMALLNLFLV